MSEHTLPGDIPGLLRRGSPVHARGLAKGCASVVVSVSEQEATIGFTQVWKGGTPWGGDLHEDYAISQKLGKLALDLSDPTGRAHAAWWLGNVPFDRVLAACDALGLSAATRKNAMESCMSPAEGWNHDADADVIRRIVLHVAGREVTP